MIDEPITARDKMRPGGGREATAPAAELKTLTWQPGARALEESPRAREPSSDAGANADCRNTRGKLTLGWRGLKSAVRGDSSFFAHGYRGTLIAITAALLGINQWGWCLLVIGACLVLIAELAYSSVDMLARSLGDAEEPRLKNAREIAAAGVLVAAVGSGAVTLIVLSWKFAELLGWRF
jgi:diacylglycerol kinase